MGGANGWTYLPTIRRSFPERERHDFTGHLQSLNTGFCIDRPPRPFSAHRPFCQRNSDRASAHIFGRGALGSVDLHG